MVHYLVGDVFEKMAEIPDGSIDLVMTSPPFLALRSYLPTGHPEKTKEIGSEATPAEYLDTLMALTAEWRRVLAPHGSICVELGDTYSGSGGAGGDYSDDGLRAGQNGFTGSAHRSRHEQPRQWSGGVGWPPQKSLTGIPTLYAWSLAYGRNLLTGLESPAGQWRIRNLVAWVRPNPPVGALADKFRPATSYLTIATLSANRYFDLEAVRTASGAPPLDWWEIVARGYSGAHYAVYPEELCVRPIESMCPRRVCLTCGEPSRRLTEVTGLVGRDGKQVEPGKWASGISEGKGAHSNKKISGTTTTTTVGWSDCGHNDWRPGMLLDPFAGSGTTLAVAAAHGRNAIGIDLDERNEGLARERVGLWFQEEPF